MDDVGDSEEFNPIGEENASEISDLLIGYNDIDLKEIMGLILAHDQTFNSDD